MALARFEADKDVRDRFSAFIANNPDVYIQKLIFDEVDDGHIEIIRPWGDPSIRLFIYKTKVEEAARILNKVKLPKVLSAIHHLENNLLEVIWTARKLKPSKAEVRDRKFEFNFKDKTYLCYFGRSSGELMFISNRALLGQSSSTVYRNLQSFKQCQEDREEDSKDEFGEPTSFFITGFDLDDEQSVQFLQHLNFYMSYYDSETPLVLLHLTEVGISPFNRYCRGDFPAVINARELDANLLNFWGAMRTSNPMMDFVISYRIIEYASIHFVEHDILNKINRVISAPHFGENKTRDLEEIAFIANVKIEEHQRIRSLVKKCCNSIKIWDEISSNRSSFSVETRFDGNFVQNSLINPNDTYQNFEKNWPFNICEAIRRLRNALSHGKDMETAGVITPTLKNLASLRPWVHLITIIAGDVILFKDVT